MRAYLIAGEASGDALGAGLMQALAVLKPGIAFDGIGGERMEALGLESLFPYHELSLMGFAEVLPHLLRLAARVDLVVEDITQKQPDVVVTIDSPGFNFRVAAKLKKSGFKGKLVHYVAPSVWAYKPQRAARCAALFDRMLCLLPFEPSYFEREGLKADFVGHPVAYQPKGDGAAFRQKYGLPPDAPLLALLPGSRENEIRRHMPIFASAATRLATLHKGLALVVPVAPRLLPLMQSYFQGCPFRAVVVSHDEDKRNALAAATLALAKSGTVTLEVAQAGCPQVVAYKAHAVSAWIIKRMMKLPYVSLVNILAEEMVLPEYLQDDCTPQALSEALALLLESARLRDVQREKARAQLLKLRLPEGLVPEEEAAKAVLS